MPNKFIYKIGRVKQIKIPNSHFLIGQIIGAFAGDGCYSKGKTKRGIKHFIRFCLSYEKDVDYKNYLFLIFQKMNLNPRVHIKKYRDKLSAFEIRICSIKFIEFIKNYLYWDDTIGSIQRFKNSKKKTYSVHLKYPLENYSNLFLIGFARGLMDTDGFVESKGVACGVVSEKLIFNLNDILIKVGIIPKVTIQNRKFPRKNLFLLRVSNNNLDNYLNKIGFSNLRKKRELLQILKK